VARDIQPDADYDDYDDLPTEERDALLEDQAALQRQASHRVGAGAADAPPRLPAARDSSAPEPKTAASPPPEGQWAGGVVAYINMYTQCGRICLPDFGDIQFSDKVTGAPGLTLQLGLEVECRHVMRHGRPWIVEFAKAQVVA
jgi:hypothetical protein